MPSSPHCAPMTAHTRLVTPAAFALAKRAWPAMYECNFGEVERAKWRKKEIRGSGPCTIQKDTLLAKQNKTFECKKMVHEENIAST